VQKIPKIAGFSWDWLFAALTEKGTSLTTPVKHLQVEKHSHKLFPMLTTVIINVFISEN